VQRAFTKRAPSSRQQEKTAGRVVPTSPAPSCSSPKIVAYLHDTVAIRQVLDLC
jgi:hypothetical protein